MLTELEIKKLTTEPEDSMLSFFIYAFERKVHLKFSSEMPVEDIEEFAEMVKKRVIMDFKDFKQNNDPSPMVSY